MTIKSASHLLSHKKTSQNPGLLLISLGSILTSMVVVGFMLGYGLDSLLGTSPIFMLLIGLLGMIGGMIRAYKMLTR